MKLVEKLSYLAESAAKWVARKGIECPSCGDRPIQVLDRKFVVTQLRRCRKCELIYRTPTGNARRMERYYERRYAEGFTTEFPSDCELAQLLATNFKNTEKDYSLYLEVLESIGAQPGMRLLDFGCSWGYGSWQLVAAGFDVSSFEISSRRCRFARERLRINAHEAIDEITGEFDIIFSSHVLEHVSAIGPTIARLWSMLRRGGKFVAFTPNGSLLYRTKQTQRWHSSWGMVHPNMLDEKYYKKVFTPAPMILASSPYPLAQIRHWASSVDQPVLCDMSGSELLCVAVKV